MHRSRWVALLLLGSAVAPAASGADWKVGVSRVAITPDELIWMAGYAARKRPAETAVHDLHAKALAIEDATAPGDSRIVFVTMDLIGVPRGLAAAASAALKERFALPRAAILWNASHTHCGPEIRPDRHEFRALPPGEEEKLAAYRPVLEKKLVDLVGRALDDLSPAHIGVAMGKADFARNRRFPTPEGFVNRRYDDGPVDHDVPVLQITTPAGKVRAILFGYACHNTTLSFHKWCGDYAGFAQSRLEAAFPDTVALFVAGCGGDQNPYPRGTLELAQSHGGSLAAAVTRALESSTAVRPPLRVAFAEVPLELQAPPSRSRLKEQLATGNIYEQRKARYLLPRLDTPGAIPTTYPVPVHVVRLGKDVLLVALGGEAVVDYAHRIKRDFTTEAKRVWVAAYSNDVFGYLPSLRVLREGGYEAVGATLYGPLPGAFTETVEERVIAGVARLVRQVRLESPSE